MKFRRMFVNPLDFKWSGTVKLSLFAKKNDTIMTAAILPVLVVRDTPAARAALEKALDEREVSSVLAALRCYQEVLASRAAKTHEFQAVTDIATNFGKLKPLNDAEIETLCQRLNR